MYKMLLGDLGVLVVLEDMLAVVEKALVVLEIPVVVEKMFVA